MARIGSLVVVVRWCYARGRCRLHFADKVYKLCIMAILVKLFNYRTGLWCSVHS